MSIAEIDEYGFPGPAPHVVMEGRVDLLRLLAEEDGEAQSKFLGAFRAEAGEKADCSRWGVRDVRLAEWADVKRAREF